MASRRTKTSATSKAAPAKQGEGEALIGERILSLGGDKVRVEPGPRRRTGKATTELLSDEKTAPHYQAGNPDADGKPIKIGETMTYLDWMGEPVFYVYRRVDDDRFEEVAVIDDRDEAIAFARKQLS